MREWVEAGLKEGRLKAVVATSSLDLGVDFLPVERVLQIGSAKGVARLLQRAGRSGHAPGRPSRVTLVPTNTLELVEAAAARRAALAGRVEARRSPDKPLDVLVQHLVTVALGGGFERRRAVRRGAQRATPTATLTRDEFDWALAFVERGGDSLTPTPNTTACAASTASGACPTAASRKRHRLQVGTIVSDAAMQVKWLSGGTLGQHRGKLHRAAEQGRLLRLRRPRARVRAHAGHGGLCAQGRRKRKAWCRTWAGGKMPLSSELADAVLALLDGAAQGDVRRARDAGRAADAGGAGAAVAAAARRARCWSSSFRSREGHHLFLYPFAGRNVHMGLAQLLAWRLAQREPNTFCSASTTTGFELLAAEAARPGRAARGRRSSRPRDLLADVLASLNSGELAQRRFREIARVAGLVFSGYPGAPKSMRQLQASSGLFFEVFRKYDAGNRLLAPGRGRGAGAGAGARAAGRQPCAAGGAAHRCGRR